MTDGTTISGRGGTTASIDEMSRRYRTLLVENDAPMSLIEELDYFLEAIDVGASPNLPPHPEAADAAVCHNLRAGLNQLRSQFVDRAAGHAAPGMGQEAMAFLHVDEADHHEALRAELERMERAVQAAGCPI